jgi:SAM-dependent methyltransferase
MLSSNPESRLAHRILDGLCGIEIGGSAYNPFNIPRCRNVDFTADMETIFKKEERRLSGKALPVDVVARGDKLPFDDGTQDYVLSSHVLEHFFDPLAAILEWQRVLRVGGILFMIVPHRERTFDKERPRTSLRELIDRHAGRIPAPSSDESQHYSVWVTEDVLSIVEYLGFRVHTVRDVDDKVGNGFTIVCEKADDQAAELRNLGLPSCAARRRPQVLFSLDSISVDSQSPLTVAGQSHIAINLETASSLRLSGWVLDASRRSPVNGVFILVDGHPLQKAYYGIDRPDCASMLGDPSSCEVGFTAGIHPPVWQSGRHELTILATDADDGAYVALDVVADVRVAPS